MNTEQALGRGAVEFKGHTYEVEVWVKYYTEQNYGADLDGNRGVPRTFIEDVELKAVTGDHATDVVNDDNFRDELHKAVLRGDIEPEGEE